MELAFSLNSQHVAVSSPGCWAVIWIMDYIAESKIMYSYLSAENADTPQIASVLRWAEKVQNIPSLITDAVKFQRLCQVVLGTLGIIKPKTFVHSFISLTFIWFQQQDHAGNTVTLASFRSDRFTALCLTRGRQHGFPGFSIAEKVDWADRRRHSCAYFSQAEVEATKAGQAGCLDWYRRLPGRVCTSSRVRF